MGKKRKKESKQLPSQKKKATQQRSLKTSIIRLLEQHQGQAFSVKQIARKLGLKQKAQLKELTFELYELAEADKIQQLSNGDYKTSRAAQTITGTVDHVNPRFAYIIPAEGDEDIYVKTLNLKSAVDGDTVEVELLPYRSGQRAEGRVVKVLKRSRNRFVGRVEMSKNFAFVVPDFRKIYQDFFIYPEKINNAKHNDKVIVEVIEWAEGDKSPEAKVVEVLGKAGENEAEIHSIMAEFGLPLRFDPKVLAESESIDEGITASEIKNRWDFRKVLTFTIDPEDAKDFDDAISFEKIKDGLYRIGVHIADVTHYVKPGTLVEAEAYDRATSVYLVDRTIPMLPERLSNQLCSLRPNEDKLCFAAVFEIDDKAEIKKEWFGRTAIHSDHRFTYEAAQEILESGKGQFAGELALLNTLAKELRRQRFAKGAVNFETTEVKFKLDNTGKPLAVVPKVRKDAHKLIEEFMLLANKQVATYIYNMKKGTERNTFVYRIHDYPDQERVQDFALFAKKFGHKLNIEESSISSSLNKLMDEIEGKPEQNVLQQLAVRAMAKAKYSTEEKGHFGLA
ncbi:MAG TPA: VacB/RNase II family 3'-5' exoribonuclease, partial [Cyclobacteriaceae bacterium]|nr:VacB/RNase II family 3'-5' exoribonuclease [Cyclobacteriaceae bacterium]